MSHIDRPAETAPSQREIQAWLVQRLSDLLARPSTAIKPRLPFDDLGLTSVDAIGVTGDLADWLALDIDPLLLYDYPTIHTLSHHLAERVAAVRR